MYFSEYEGVFYIEGNPPDVIKIKVVDYKLNLFFGQAHLKTLDDIKDKLNLQVKELGGNCVYDFKYGQTSSWWKSIFGLDDIHWFATGVIGFINNPESLSH